MHPVLLDFVGGSAYLVVNSNRIHLHPAVYGCPDLPYAYLKYDEQAKRWLPIDRAQAPAVLSRANLSYQYPGFAVEQGDRWQSKEEIDAGNQAAERTTSGFFNATLPTGVQSWTYRLKTRYSNTRYHGDCRPALPAPVDALTGGPGLPALQQAAAEILETQQFQPARVLSSEEWGGLARNPGNAERCQALLQPAGGDDPRLETYRAFVKNPARITRSIRPTICADDVLWVLDYASDPASTVLIKANAFGDVLYRVSFARPPGADRYSGNILTPTFRAEGGYLYFEWWNASASGREWQVRSFYKMRIAEPGA